MENHLYKDIFQLKHKLHQGILWQTHTGQTRWIKQISPASADEAISFYIIKTCNILKTIIWMQM